jgi:uncharacterized protein (TIGR02118 family)
MTSPRTTAPDAGASAGAPPTAKNMAAVVVLYHHPKDPEAFEKYYAEVHGPLVYRHARAIGLRRADFTKFSSGLGGERPQFYRQASLWFDSEDALRKAMGMPEFGEVAGDLGNFATGGVTGMIAVKTND